MKLKIRIQTTKMTPNNYVFKKNYDHKKEFSQNTFVSKVAKSNHLHTKLNTFFVRKN